MPIKYFHEVGSILIDDTIYAVLENGNVDWNNYTKLSDLNIREESKEWFETLTFKNQNYIKTLLK